MTKRINVKCQRALAHIPGANIEEFLVTILSEANSRMVKNYFRGAEWVLGKSPSKLGIFGKPENEL